MSDEFPNATYSPEYEWCQEENKVDESVHKMPKCFTLALSDNIKAYIEQRKLEREIKPLQCSKELIEKVVSNYIIVKEILSNLSWQDKFICKQVCTTWNSAIQALRKEEMGPVDFMIDLRTQTLSWTVLKSSNKFFNEPMVVMNFSSSPDMRNHCKLIEPSPCQTTCLKSHSLLDVVQKYISGPKDCMKTVRSDYLSYMPLQPSVTYQHTITQLKMSPHMVGLVIPVIPDVKCHTINIKTIKEIQDNFYDTIIEISKERIFKGVFVYVTDKYILNSVQDIIFLEIFKELQPDIPYALGGCIIEDTLFDQKDINGLIKGINDTRDYYSQNLISIYLFTVPKSPGSNEYNFDMYSLVLDSSDWSKAKVQDAIKDFSKKVPQFEHSAVVKLSCVGRDQKLKWEQDCFRAVFPNTRLVGCFGNGELGINHPPRQTEAEDKPHSSAKRHRNSEPEFGIVYSYSTVFVYMGWGKILSKEVP